MSETSIAKIQKCLVMRNGIEIWLDADKSERVEMALVASPKGMLRLEGRLINAVDIIGIYLPEDLTDMQNRKQGMWKCKHNKWHNKGDDCTCHTNRDDYQEMKITQGSPEVAAAIEKTREQLLANKVI